MKVTNTQASQLVTLRALVGFLGEAKQSKWWDSSFLSPTGRRFLQTTFPRTASEAALRSTSEAARLVHDARIGRVRMFHLFRLPEVMEAVLDGSIREFGRENFPEFLTSKETALAKLEELSGNKTADGQGPVQICLEKDGINSATISRWASHYKAAFNGGFQTFPYFTVDGNAS